MESPRHDFRFQRALRLTHDREFQAVFEAMVRKSADPLLVYGLPNGRRHSRLGLSVSRRVGGAVVRNRVKRLLREAFRLTHHAWPGHYDVVIVVRPHAPRSLEDYQRTLIKAVEALHRSWLNRPSQPVPPAPQ